MIKFGLCTTTARNTLFSAQAHLIDSYDVEPEGSVRQAEIEAAIVFLEEFAERVWPLASRPEYPGAVATY